MPLEQRLDMEKPWFLVASLATLLTFFTVACLLIRNATAPVSATPPGAGSSYRAENELVSSNAAEAAQTPAAQMPAEPAPAEQTPRGPAAPKQNPDEPTADPIYASEQSTFKARRALETIDPREFLR